MQINLQHYFFLIDKVTIVIRNSHTHMEELEFESQVQHLT